MEKLSDFYIEKAKNDLNETESRKEQSIKQFYEWLSKHPFITKCEIDPSQIVQFLRARKYQMSKVYESFNKIIKIHQNFSYILNYSNLYELNEIYEKGPFLIMKNYDKNGRRICIFRHKLLENLNVTFHNILKLNQMISAFLLAESEVQICGIVTIHDVRDISMKYMKIMDVNILGKVASISEFGALRLKQIIILGLPAIANSLFEIVKTFLNDKIKNRIDICKNVEDLTKVLDVKDLTVEYGGTDNSNDCIKYHKKAFDIATIKLINFLNNLEVDEEKMRNYENKTNFEDFTSLRKLEID
ncbi:unnamed protein product [Chironomus riparius]|uniref:CRAL-TRIO domain-containing protein n=1 Tax=Chironomus riparius TaxID=315576 RepID=A0A9N9S7M0_9DIPT|nr:unnamed protein product [Chironomus riparius]